MAGSETLISNECTGITVVSPMSLSIMRASKHPVLSVRCSTVPVSVISPTIAFNSAAKLPRFSKPSAMLTMAFKSFSSLKGYSPVHFLELIVGLVLSFVLGKEN